MCIRAEGMAPAPPCACWQMLAEWSPTLAPPAAVSPAGPMLTAPASLWVPCCLPQDQARPQKAPDPG